MGQIADRNVKREDQRQNQPGRQHNHRAGRSQTVDQQPLECRADMPTAFAGGGQFPAATAEQVIEVSERCVATRSHIQVRLLLPNAQNRLQPPVTQPGQPDIDLAIAQWCFDRNDPAGLGTDTLPAASLLYLPLKAPLRTRGVLAVAPEQRRLLMIPEQRRLLDIAQRIHRLDDLLKRQRGAGHRLIECRRDASDQLFQR